MVAPEGLQLTLWGFLFYFRFWEFSNTRPKSMTICSNQAISFSKKGASEVLSMKYIPIT